VRWERLHPQQQRDLLQEVRDSAKLSRVPLSRWLEQIGLPKCTYYRWCDQQKAGKYSISRPVATRLALSLGTQRAVEVLAQHDISMPQMFPAWGDACEALKSDHGSEVILLRLVADVFGVLQALELSPSLFTSRKKSKFCAMIRFSLCQVRLECRLSLGAVDTPSLDCYVRQDNGVNSPLLLAEISDLSLRYLISYCSAELLRSQYPVLSESAVKKSQKFIKSFNESI